MTTLQTQPAQTPENRVLDIRDVTPEVLQTATAEQIIQLITTQATQQAILDLILKSGQIELAPILIAGAKATQYPYLPLNNLSSLYPKSFVESHAANPEIGAPLEDAYSQRYLKQFIEKGGDAFKRGKKTGIPCSGMEESFYYRFRSNNEIVITSSEGEPKTVWVYKCAQHGGSDEDWDILLNLATLEAYTPNRKIRDKLHPRRKKGPITTKELLELAGNNEIHFARHLHYVDNAVPSSVERDVMEIMKHRERLLATHVPLECGTIPA